MSLPDPNQPYVTGVMLTQAGPVPKIASSLSWADRLGSFKARWRIGRMDYTVDPGLYALGNPDDRSPVLVSANYKMSFDRLRQAMSHRDAWILVLDTDGINVWCAAGKGTFGTEELVRRTASSQVAKVVSHRELVLPQLAGPGVAAHHVRKRSGFRVVYGPVRSADLPAFMDAGFEATPEMRRKTFDILERAVLIPVELVGVLKWAMIILPMFFLLSGLGGPDTFWVKARDNGFFAVLSLLAALASGTIMTPLLLPWLPGRAFSLKGLSAGLVTAGMLTIFRWGNVGYLEAVAWFFLIPAISAFLGMNFTGASTYTSLSGVKKEMKWAVPLEIGAGVIGLCLWLGSRVTA